MSAAPLLTGPPPSVAFGHQGEERKRSFDSLSFLLKAVAINMDVNRAAKSAPSILDVLLNGRKHFRTARSCSWASQRLWPVHVRARVRAFMTQQLSGLLPLCWGAS